MAKNPWRLTKKEYEVVTAIVTGHTTQKKIAERLSMSEKTVQTHVQNICNKMQLEDRNKTAIVLRFMGWI